LYDPESGRDKAMSKEDLIKRHSDYVILHNANQDADAKHQKTAKDLRTQLYKQEKISRSDKPAESIKGNGSKEAKSYQKEHRDMYKELEEQARQARAGKSALKKEDSIQEIEVL
jgi:hypothetical protein